MFVFLLFKLDVNCWDVIEEVILHTIQPSPKNPFKIDFTKLEKMLKLEKALNTASLINFLKKIYLTNINYQEEGDQFKFLKF